MDRVLLLLVALIGTTAAQQRFDSMGRPLFEVVTPNPVPQNSRPSLHVDRVDLNAAPSVPRPSPFDPRLPTMSPPPPPPPTSSAAPLNVSSRQQIGIDGPPRPALQVQRPPPPPVKPPAETQVFGVLPNGRIRVDGFQPIDRRFATRKRRFLNIPDSPNEDSVDVKDKEDFLLAVSSSRKFSDLESFDQNDSEVDNDVDSESSGDSQFVRPVVFPSYTSLHPESGYQEAATQIEKNLSKARFMPKSELISQIEQQEEEHNSISSDTIDGSAFEEVATVTNEPTEEENVLYNTMSLLDLFFGIPRNRPAEEDSVVGYVEITTEDGSDKDVDSTVENTTPSSRAAVSTPTPTSPNSVPLFRDSKLVRIVKDYAGFIVGTILGIPATVVLCYFIYLKRLKRYTGTLDVSPRPIIFNHKKSESRKTIYSTSCSEENELSCSPSASTSKTPPPPPFPTHYKKYVK